MLTEEQVLAAYNSGELVQKLPAKKAKRPSPLIDPSEWPCEICAGHQPGHCDKCTRAIPEYPNMLHQGYRSPSPTHRHLEWEPGVAKPLKRDYYAELCLACYRVAFEEENPGVPCPV